MEFTDQLIKKQQIVNDNNDFLIKGFQMLIKLIFVHLEMSPDVTTSIWYAEIVRNLLGNKLE